MNYSPHRRSRIRWWRWTNCCSRLWRTAAHPPWWQPTTGSTPHGEQQIEKRFPNTLLCTCISLFFLLILIQLFLAQRRVSTVVINSWTTFSTGVVITSCGVSIRNRVLFGSNRPRHWGTWCRRLMVWWHFMLFWRDSFDGEKIHSL